MCAALVLRSACLIAFSLNDAVISTASVDEIARQAGQDSWPATNIAERVLQIRGLLSADSEANGRAKHTDPSRALTKDGCACALMCTLSASIR
jgi:hypothetical protein